MYRFSKLAQWGVFATALAIAPAFAQSYDQPGTAPSSQGTASPQNGTGTATGPMGDTSNTPYNQYPERRTHSFGWVGLIGLAGLLGLTRRGRTDVDTTTRDYRNTPRA